MIDDKEINEVLNQYAINTNEVQIKPINQGLINNTWKILTQDNAAYILQRLNDKVFSNPRDIDYNINLIGDHLKEHHPQYYFVNTITSKDGGKLIHKEGLGYFRMFPYVTGSHTQNTVQSADQAYEAALQFGRFTKVLKAFDATQLKQTIPSFHDISLRYKQFSSALRNGHQKRLSECIELIKEIKKWHYIVDEYDKLKSTTSFKLRVTHHDTKISNVLFDEYNKGICVIDLDTVMPGYFISDVGDMMRTYLPSVNEEEADFNKIDVRPDYYKAIVTGYVEEMNDELSSTEKQLFFFAGTFLIYMQALRFLTDYLNNDVYYGASYPEHNFIRAKNQIVLLQRLTELKSDLSGFC